MLRRTVAWLAAFAAFALAHAWTLANPGWFSHDELQWGHLADAEPRVAVDWLDNTVFQYRPLTFQLWVWIADALFAQPRLYHALWVLLGFGVCALLYSVLRRAGATWRVAAAGAAAFALNPYAAYVHGWVATLSELLWTSCALAIAWFAFDARRTPRQLALAAFVFTTLALLAKETALAIAPLLALAWLLTRAAAWRAALLGSLVPTIVYLALRLPTLLFAPRPDGAYAWSLGNIGSRLAEFHLWLLVPTVLEMTSLPLANPYRIAAVACVAVLLAAAVLWAHRRIGVALLAGTALALGPAVVLTTGYPQYGYAASALACVCLAMAWPAMRLPSRALVLFALVMACWHGANVQREMLRVGRIEARFTPQLRAMVTTPGETVVLVPERTADRWIYARLSTSLPYAMRGVEVRESGAGVRVHCDGGIAFDASPQSHP